MTAPTPKIEDSPEIGAHSRSGFSRDIVWNRPVFRPPFLPNPRIIFDPLPFTAGRLPVVARPGKSR